MAKGTEVHSGITKAIYLLVTATAIMGFLLVSATPQYAQEGLKLFGGWNQAAIRNDSAKGVCVAAVKGINGEVGRRLVVSGPTASCTPDPNWAGTPRIISGDLPPGMNFDSKLGIKGTPREKGDWIVQVELKDLQCNGVTYMGFSQELRFHISDSAKVTE